MGKTVDEKGNKNIRAKYGVMLDDVYQKIKGMMYHSQLVPGQKIIYGDLARQLNTSTTPVIQALKRLESSKIVRYFPNKGYFVMEVTETELRELYESRDVVELSIMPKIIARITPHEISQLRKYLRGLQTLDPRERGLFDEHFHLAIAKYVKNDVIYDVLKEIYDRIYLRYKPQYLEEHRFKEAMEEHRAIFEALAGRNLEALLHVVKSHIANQLDYTIHYMMK